MSETIAGGATKSDSGHSALLPLMGLPAIFELNQKRHTLQQADQKCLDRALAARLERIAAQCSWAQVAKALFLQSATPHNPLQLFRTILLGLFILWGLVVFGKERFVAMLFDNAPSEERLQFVSDLLRSRRWANGIVEPRTLHA